MAEQSIPSRAERPGASPMERRAWVRFQSDQEIRCEPVGANAVWLGSVRDVSRGGMALILPRRFDPGTVLSVELLLTKDDGPGRLVVRVVHARQDKTGSWIMGCAFARPLSEEELQALIKA